MKFHDISLDIKHMPPLDPGFVPIAAFNRAYNKIAKKELAVAVERENNQKIVFSTHIIDDGAHNAADEFYVERLVKLLLWAAGGFRVTIYGNEKIANIIQKAYGAGGERAFDSEFMSGVYEHDFEVLSRPYADKPDTNETPVSLSRDFSGCRIGFDAGGSDWKVSAVIDGEAVFSKETVWHPKTTTDPSYHYSEIVKAFKMAASKMPRVDAIGVSSAGIYVNNRTMVASLFRVVPSDDFQKVVKNIYIDAGKEIGDVPLVVANDGDVSALAGAISLNEPQILGIAMGTSLAAGYVDKNGNITGRLNELAFAPVDGQVDGAVDEWSGDKGCGVKHMSQDAVALLAPKAGIQLPDGTPAEKLKFVQALMEDDSAAAEKIYQSIGCYLGHTLALYREVYDCKHVLLLGRVMSGKGGNIILEKAEQVLRDDYPEIQNLQLHLPDEKIRRVGQSVAAAALPANIAAHKKKENFSVTVEIGEHITGSVVVNGKTYGNVGANIGHMVIVNDGKPCVCGRNGCLDAYSSISGLIAMTKDAMQEDKESLMWQSAPTPDAVDAHTAFTAARNGDKAGKAVVSTYVHYLACGICNLVNVFQPETIYVKSDICKEGEELLFAPVREIVRREDFNHGDKKAEICFVI